MQETRLILKLKSNSQPFEKSQDQRTTLVNLNTGLAKSVTQKLNNKDNAEPIANKRKSTANLSTRLTQDLGASKLAQESSSSLTKIKKTDGNQRKNS